ncbi:small GTPase [Lithospermum erythrorhizon]|uniref:Small GTPase n=1 Tax=Lithospermum erythrorhizon TaxID=34254 RepID=A0AAV3RMX4_LITER
MLPCRWILKILIVLVFAGNMMSIKDWVLSQIVSNSIASSRPLSASESFFSGQRQALEVENDDEGISLSANNDTPLVSSGTIQAPSNDVENQNVMFHPGTVDSSLQSALHVDEKTLGPLERIEGLQIKFLRVLQRFGMPVNDPLVSKVLYRVHLATLIRGNDSDLKSANLRSDRARAIAAEQDLLGLPTPDFSFRILVLGKTGVGKSSTINSILNQAKSTTDAFQPATKCVQEIEETLNGIKISFIDTPGLLPSSPTTLRRNKRILSAVKKFVRKSPPDMVLYFERLDLINTGYSDLPLLKLITEVFGPAVWFNTVLVMTHSSANLPEGLNGYPVNYESYVTRCSDLVQHHIHQAVSDSKLENPVILVENHPLCKTNNTGEKILPNGQAWRSQFLLLCICTKVLSDVNVILDFKDSVELGPIHNKRLPSLPHLLSSFLKHRPQITLSGADSEVDETYFSDSDEEDEYDQLPPIRILTRSQFEKLSSSQKKDYLDELDYRETLYMKKQLRERYRQQKQRENSPSGASTSNDDSGDQDGAPEPVLLPDMTVPPSFGSECPVHRYRCLVTSDQWLARPVLDPHGWDNDVGFDGINLETAAEIRKNVVTCLAGQMSKDKQDFSIQSQCVTAFMNPRGPTYSVGLDVQSANKELICTLHGNAKVRNFRHNLTEGGVCVTSFGDKLFFGTKIEDSISIGKRLKFVMNVGRMGGTGQMANGGSFEATIRGKDYAVRNEKVSFTMTALSFDKEMVLGGNLQSDFRLSRGTQISLNANLNSRKMGQISVKTSSSDHIEIAFIALLSMLRALFRKRSSRDNSVVRVDEG